MATTCPRQSDGTVTLRPLVPDDVGALVAGEDDDLVHWLTGARDSPLSARRWIDDCAADWAGDWYEAGTALAWGLCDTASGGLAGMLEVQLSSADLAAGEANLSYGVFPEWRGRRFAARAVVLTLPWLATCTGTRNAVIRVDPENVHSMRVPVDAGFRRAGRSRRLARFVRPV